MKPTASTSGQADDRGVVLQREVGQCRMHCAKLARPKAAVRCVSLLKKLECPRLFHKNPAISTILGCFLPILMGYGV